MGHGASTAAEYSSQEKVEIAQAIDSKLSALKDETDEIALFEAIKTTYSETDLNIKKKRGEAPAETDDSSNDFNSNAFELKGSFVYHPFESSKDGLGALPKHEAAAPMMGKLMKQKTSSQLLSEMNESVADDQEKIANFISQLKAGDVQTQKTSAFRQRRLTYTQKTVDEPVEAQAQGDGSGSAPVASPAKRPRNVRTTIFASSEIGVVREKSPPFPDSVLGTYSCHGIEPSYEEEDGIHEKINQDRGCCVYPYNSSRNEALFIVLDGHGEQGDKVSEFVMRQIVISLEKDCKLNEDPVNALKTAFVMTNTALLVTQIQYMTSGCTCVAVYAKGNTLYCANAGDSRAVMAYTDEEGNIRAKDLSRDHKPDDPEEEARITKWGGYVCPPPEPGLSARVYLDPEFTMIGLAMARSIGDHAVKAVGVIPDPEVKTFEVEANDKFFIMASDGVWEFITSEEAVQIVNKNIDKGVHDACQELIETAAARWQDEEGDYRDDITAIVVRVPLPYTQQ